MKRLNQLVFPVSKYLLLLCLIIALGSCDLSFDPLNEDKGLYSIYGGLNINAEENYIRVKNLNEPITRTADDSLDAVVRLNNITDNTTQILDFKTVVFDSIKTFNYRATMNIEPESVYEVIVEKPDGRTVTATAETPAIADRVLTPENRICGSQVNIEYSPVRPDEIIFADIGFEYNGQKFWLENLQALETEAQNTVRLSYSLPEIINRRLDPEIEPDETICDFVTSNVVEVRYRHLGPDYLLDTQTDTLRIPDEAKNLVGYYNDNFSYTFN